VTELSTTEAVLVALRRIMRAVDLRSRRLVAQHGVTGPQLILLKEIERREHLSVSELCRDVHLSQATVTGILDRLEKRGLVGRRRSEQDRRRVVVSLTDEGAAVLDTAPELMQETFVAAFEGLRNWEKTLILSSLQRVVAMMEAEEIDSAPMLVSGPIKGAADSKPVTPGRPNAPAEAGPRAGNNH